MGIHNREKQDMSPFVSLPILFNFRGSVSSEWLDDIGIVSVSSQAKLTTGHSNRELGRQLNVETIGYWLTNYGHMKSEDLTEFSNLI